MSSQQIIHPLLTQFHLHHILFNSDNGTTGIDELHIAIAPVVLGQGERLFDGVDMQSMGYECERFVASEKTTHVIIRRKEIEQNDA